MKRKGNFKYKKSYKRRKTSLYKTIKAVSRVQAKKLMETKYLPSQGSSQFLGPEGSYYYNLLALTNSGDTNTTIDGNEFYWLWTRICGQIESEYKNTTLQIRLSIIKSGVDLGAAVNVGTDWPAGLNQGFDANCSLSGFSNVGQRIVAPYNPTAVTVLYDKRIMVKRTDSQVSLQGSAGQFTPFVVSKKMKGRKISMRGNATGTDFLYNKGDQYYFCVHWYNQSVPNELSTAGLIRWFRRNTIKDD